ncbi:hypothetical protein B296_00035825 [Ensete ventricosum]|uniref:Uncharacterized protein n=1 Tax=Ensete ventricosum TaxID=4639 RepID=A0A426XWG9_ENSVE|nr:hypothetical protein B296_00035825 [Ensete ventricosum]
MLSSSRSLFFCRRLHRHLVSLVRSPPLSPRSTDPNLPFGSITLLSTRLRSLSFSSESGGGGDGETKDPWNVTWGGSDQPQSSSSSSSGGLDWGEASSWSTGLTKEHFDGEAIGRQVSPTSELKAQAKGMDDEEEILRMLEKDNKESKAFVDGWRERLMETYRLLKHVREPGVRGAYLKDSEKAEMYRLHKENPEVYTVERLAKDYRIMRQRVHAILWLKEMEEEEEKKRGKPLDDSVEILLDNFPE